MDNHSGPLLSRVMPLLLTLALASACAGQGSSTGGASSCSSDPAHWVRTATGCLVMQAYGAAPQAETLVLVLHGDVSSGGPANYHRAIAKRIAETLPGAAVVALVRPGYPDGDGRTSDGSNNGRSDHITRENIGLVAGAIAEVRARIGARRVVVIGHSGGAATAADILALHPGVIDAAVLLACPCDIPTWRGARRPWVQSVSPLSVADRVPATARVAAYTGTADTNTSPALARSYVGRLAARGINATFAEVPGATHNGVVEAVWSTDFPQVLLRFAAAR